MERSAYLEWQNGKNKEKKAPQKKGHLSKTLREMGKDIPGGQGRAHTKDGDGGRCPWGALMGPGLSKCNKYNRVNEDEK